jgi:hypothetical protein
MQMNGLLLHVLFYNSARLSKEGKCMQQIAASCEQLCKKSMPIGCSCCDMVIMHGWQCRGSG